jgi:hypothetical protein
VKSRSLRGSCRPCPPSLVKSMQSIGFYTGRLSCSEQLVCKLGYQQLMANTREQMTYQSKHVTISPTDEERHSEGRLFAPATGPRVV